MTYAPDRWIMLRIVTERETPYKLPAGWVGGYLYGDSWRLNSGCTSVRKVGDSWEFIGYPGSVYRCRGRNYGVTSLTVSVLQRLREKVESEGATLEVMPKDTNWKTLLRGAGR